MKLSQFTNSDIKCEQEISFKNWKRLAYSFDKKERNLIYKACNEFESCIIRKTNGTQSNLKNQHTWQFPERPVEWFEIEFITNWTTAQARQKGYIYIPGLGYPTGINKSFNIPIEMWFTVNRLIISKLNLI